MIYRTYLIRKGRIAKGDNIDAASLAEAIAASRLLLAEQPSEDGYDGIEIWQSTSLLYSDTTYYNSSSFDPDGVVSSSRIADPTAPASTDLGRRVRGSARLAGQG